MTTFDVEKQASECIKAVIAALNVECDRLRAANAELEMRRAAMAGLCEQAEAKVTELEKKLAAIEKGHSEEAGIWDEKHAHQVTVWRKAEVRAEQAEQRAERKAAEAALMEAAYIKAGQRAERLREAVQTFVAIHIGPKQPKGLTDLCEAIAADSAEAKGET